MIKKRQQLFARDPLAWAWVMQTYKTISYSNTANFYIKKKPVESKYTLSSHAFRRFYLTWISKDAAVAKSIIGHCSLSTTYEYRDYREKLPTEQRLANTLFNQEFGEAIKSNEPKNESVASIWADIKQQTADRRQYDKERLEKIKSDPVLFEKYQARRKESISRRREVYKQVYQEAIKDTLKEAYPDVDIEKPLEN